MGFFKRDVISIIVLSYRYSMILKLRPFEFSPWGWNRTDNTCLPLCIISKCDKMFSQSYNLQPLAKA